MENKPNLLRITQMNAVYLDNEIYKTILQLIQDSLKNLPPGFTASYDFELNLFVKLVLLYNSIYRNNCSFGQQLLSIKYDNLTKSKKFLYIFFNCCEYFKNRLEYWRPSHTINKKIFNIQMFLNILNFLNMSIFLRNGVKPLLIERILGLNQVYAIDNPHRIFTSKYLTRELLWNGFIEILVNFLPLINYYKVKRLLRIINPFHKKPNYNVLKKRAIMTVDSRCTFCNKNPILPHHMGCEHIFCYVCLKGNQTADSQFECPICEYVSFNNLCEEVKCI